MCSPSSPKADTAKKQPLRILLSRNQLDELMIGGGGGAGSGGGGGSRYSAPTTSGGSGGDAFAGLRIA
jgi:hypothetical protein